MTYTKEQAEEIKKQLLEQVKTLPQPEDKKGQIEEYIKKLDEAGLEDFLKKNNIKISETGKPTQESPETQEPEEPIFAQIVQGKIPSYKIAENTQAIAILELNPVSKGHSLILPRQQTTIEKLPKPAMSLAQKIAKKIKSKLKPEDIKIETSSFQNYPMINIIPIYKDQPPEKKQASESELKSLQSKLETKKRAPRISKQPTITKDPLKNLPEVHFRIP